MPERNAIVARTNYPHASHESESLARILGAVTYTMWTLHSQKTHYYVYQIPTRFVAAKSLDMSSVVLTGAFCFEKEIGEPGSPSIVARS
ncbi:hypothetical protein N7478_006808 [Penicillium angulare]|uniref:uncharacterized protein n=1 Tax=Penicillium angulare TaxID=116970 RepID=UPI0025426772|nr:uncharacterized protein N7478_006808 [Penicillium angulare]KAJ5281436.1 hypothetical protein N7478_006808 [Penicillium angulare]